MIKFNSLFVSLRHSCLFTLVLDACAFSRVFYSRFVSLVSFHVCFRYTAVNASHNYIGIWSQCMVVQGNQGIGTSVIYTTHRLLLLY